MQKTEPLENFSVRLRAAMARRKVTLQDVAKACGVAVSTVGAWSQGKNWPQVEVQPRLAQFLDSTISFLIHGLTEYPEHQAVKTAVLESPPAASREKALSRAVHEGDPAAVLERAVREHFESVLDQAKGDPVRLGWMMQQMIEYLSPPSSWRDDKKNPLVPASPHALTTRAQTELLSSETGKPIQAAQPSRRARPA